MKAAEEAIAERLVTDLGDGRYSFAHALVRDTLYEELSPPKRSALHERAGLAIEEICGGNVDERLGELAHHFLEAAPRGDLAKAIDYAQRAGEQDMEQLAYEDAVDVYGRALEVLELMDEPDEALRCSLLLSLGGAEAKSARVADAREAFERAAESARRLDDTDSLVGAAIGIAMMSDAGPPRREAPGAARRGAGADRAGADRSPGGVAQRQVGGDVLGRQRPQPSRRGWSTRRSRSPARSMRRASLAAALQRKIFIPTGPEAARERLAIADEMLELGRALAATARPSSAATPTGSGAIWSSGDVAAVDRELTPYARLAEELRMPEHTWHTFALRGMRVLLDGRDRRGRAAGRAGAAGRRPGRAGDLRSSTTASR